MKRVVAYLESEGTRSGVVALLRDNLRFLGADPAPELVARLGRSAYDSFVSEWMKDDQYAVFPSSVSERVASVYGELARSLALIARSGGAAGTAFPGGSGLDAELGVLVSLHRDRLLDALDGASPSPGADGAVCAEYSAELQARVLRLDEAGTLEPLLDIGCGRNRSLVRLLGDRGLRDVYGIDRYSGDGERVLNCDWLDFDYSSRSWGTVVAHLSFSNHCLRRRSDAAAFRRYCAAYRSILESLIVGGVFVYAPALDELEAELDPARFSLIRYRNAEDRSLDTVHVRRLG